MKNFLKGFADGVIWAFQAPMIPLLRAFFEAQGKPVLRLRLTMAIYGFLVWMAVGIWVAMFFDLLLHLLQ